MRLDMCPPLKIQGITSLEHFITVLLCNSDIENGGWGWHISNAFPYVEGFERLLIGEGVEAGHLEKSRE